MAELSLREAEVLELARHYLSNHQIAPFRE
jgi:ATP/maltotriose-dependent transcriptional regulator MalT